MERIGIVTNDPRLKSDLQKWFEEIPGEFEFVGLGPPATGDPPDTAEASSPIATEVPDKIRLVIFDSNVGQPLSKLREDLKLTAVPWLAIGLEEHAHNPHAALINMADDLILVPLDRSVFLQKVEYLLAGVESVTPSFLFLAKADLPIELAKAVHITHLSETGCTILAPRPLARGIEGTLLCRLFGEGPLERVEVRAVDSNPVFDSAVANPQGAAAPVFEVKLRFFGLRHRQLLAVRKWMSAHQPQGFPDIVRSDKEPKSIMHIAMISPQPELGALVRSSLEKLAKIEIEDFAGFKRFQGELLIRAARETKKTEPTGPHSAMTWTKSFIGPRTRDQLIPLFPHSPITLHMRVPSETIAGSFEKIAPTLKAHELLFTHAWPTWSQDSANFTKMMKTEDREAFDEAVQWAINNSTLTHHPETRLTVECQVSETEKIFLNIRLSLAEAPTPAKSALIKIIADDATETELVKSLANAAKTYEAVLVDASVLSVDLKTKLVQVGEWLETFNVRNSFGTRPPIVVFNAKEDRVQSYEFRGTPVRQLAYDFNDRRYQAELFISLSRSELWTSPQLSIAGLKTDLEAYLGRPAQASGVSEVSLIVNDRAPLRRGTELLVLSPIWSQAPEGLWARLRIASAKDDSFENEFIFFGVSDLVQKEIRKFTRDDYIKKKAQGQG